MNDTRYDLEIEKWMIRGLLFFGLLWVVLFAIIARAEPLRFEAQAGQCQHGKSDEGVWWSSYYSTNMDLKSSCWSLAVSRAEGSWKGNPYGWRVAYVELGRVKADNTFTVSEPQYPGETGENCVVDSTGNTTGCLGRGRMYQRTKGVSLGAFLEQPLTPDFTLGVEGGAYVYYSRFEGHISLVPDEKFPNNSVVYRWGSWSATPYVGITARYDYLFATLRTYFSVKAREPSIQNSQGFTSGPAYQATIGVQVPWK